MKLNNKGFAISGILYAVMILFLTLIISLLSMISNRKLMLDKYKKEVKEKINTSSETYGARIQISPDSTYVRIDESEILAYDFLLNVSACLKGGSSVDVPMTLCQNNETDITSLMNYKIYDQDDNEVIRFSSTPLISSDNFEVSRVYYSYYQKDSKGNYMIDETNKNLKTVKNYLLADKENIFFVKYSVVDNNNVPSKEETRTIFIKKYDNYVNVVTNYFKIGINNANSYNYLNNANSYKYDNSSLVKDNSLLNYALYNSDDEAIDNNNFYRENGNLYYRTSGVEKLVSTDEKFRVRYFTGTIKEPHSQIEFAYFNFE